MLADCHCHLDQFPDIEIPPILARADEAGVKAIILAGTTIQSSQRCADLAATHQPFYLGVGIHPTEVTSLLDDATYQQLHDIATGSPRTVVVSETGLDYLPDSPDHAIQEQSLRQHIRLARDLRLPVVFHSREAHPDMLRVLREERIWETGGVFHYFQGDEATARAALEMGVYISLARPLLRLSELQEVARNLPLDSFVLESDSFPQPFKKYRRNWTEPRHVAEVAEKLAELQNVTAEEVADITTRNLNAVTGGRFNLQD